MHETMVRLAFPPGLDLDGAATYLQSRGLALVDQFPESNRAPAEWVFALPAGGHPEVHVLDDNFLRVPAFVIVGEAAAVVEAADTLKRELGCRDRATALAYLSEASGHAQADALLRLAVASPRQFDNEVFQVLVAHLNATTGAVRLAVVMASVHLSWAAFEAPLVQLSLREPDPVARRNLDTVLVALAETSGRAQQ